MKNGQLDGIRVLDLSRVLAGPMACQMLGDLGAEVIKVERPVTGDESRYHGPPFFDSNAANAEMESAIYLCANRNKRSITVEFQKPEGRDLLHRLIAVSDVVVENYKVGTLAKYDLDYESAKAINPGLIYCSVTGYGQTGPDRYRPGYDAIFQGEAGLMHSIGHPDEQPGGGPMRVGFSIVDVVTSLYADIAILGALYRRDARGGGGEYIDMALLDSCVGVMAQHATHYLMSGEVPKRRGNGAGGGGVPAGVFSCADGDIVITVGNDEQFRRFCTALGRADLAADPRFTKNQDRATNRDLLGRLLNEILGAQPAAFWTERLIKADLAVGAVNNLAEVFVNEQVRARQIELSLQHRSGRKLGLVANPIKYRNNPIDTYTAPPAMGEHTSDVLKGVLGLNDADIARLSAGGVL